MLCEHLEIAQNRKHAKSYREEYKDTGKCKACYYKDLRVKNEKHND